MAQPLCSVEQYYLGVDVGTASVRVALVTRTGLVKATAEEPIRIWEPSPGHYVQSSDDIWEQCCRAIKKVTQAVEKGQIRGIGFDATCSLVVLDAHFEPVAVNRDGIRDHNVVMWMDHRASEQAARITATDHSVLRRMGGTMFLEMQPPKLLWLKENLRETCWDRAAHFMDLPDFLSWKATGSLARSLCTLVCKWTYCPQDGWDSSFWTAIGLEDLLADNYAKIGQLTCCPGTPLGAGLTLQAAADTHLEAGTAVAASLVDAHAGGLGVIGADVKGFRLPCEDRPMTSRMALICGTSSCHMGISQKPLYVPGVWGPYFSAMVPGLWLNEGGQSATGKLIDHMVEGHTAFAQLQALADESGEGIYSYLNRHLETMAGGSGRLAQLSTNLHIWPDFHGNRSPLADPTLRGMTAVVPELAIAAGRLALGPALMERPARYLTMHEACQRTVVGLTLSRTLDDLALLYLATLQAIALGTRHILQTMEEAGYDISTLFLCGGLSKNTLFVQTHADVTGLPIVLPCQTEAVLVGAAILGAYASHDYVSIQDAMEKMAKVGKVIWPNPELKSFYSRKYRVFLQLANHQRAYASLMRD